jgi:hypothetical protein
MSAALALLDARTLLAEPDWTSLGLVSAIVGCFLIANASLFEHPMRLVERHFAPREERRLLSIREHIYNRVQITLGFSFLMGGFGMALVGRFRPLADGRPAFSLAWVGVFVIVTIALLLGGWWWSLQAFRRYVRVFCTETELDLEGDPTTARELGELFGIDPRAEDTVESYVARLRQKAGLARPGVRRTPIAPSLRAEPEEEPAPLAGGLGREGGVTS